MARPISRRSFLKILAAAGSALLTGYFGFQQVAPSRTVQGRLLGPSAAKGHRIREHHFFPPPAKMIEQDVVIVGGGISGLSAAWWLNRHGFNQFTLLEMESSVGGNSRSGKNEISAYPWAAHYVPIPGPDAKLVRALFEELGVIRGYDKSGKPIYD
jgi:NADPH-dependent 2,4-dienoyl-CoA reductase/sulfur reductase-like enzyme